MQAVKISVETRRNYHTKYNVLACWRWCVDNFGYPGTRWQWDTHQTFMFNEPFDALLFTKTWCKND